MDRPSARRSPAPESRNPNTPEGMLPMLRSLALAFAFLAAGAGRGDRRAACGLILIDGLRPTCRRSSSVLARDPRPGEARRRGREGDANLRPNRHLAQPDEPGHGSPCRSARRPLQREIGTARAGAVGRDFASGPSRSWSASPSSSTSSSGPARPRRRSTGRAPARRRSTTTSPMYRTPSATRHRGSRRNWARRAAPAIRSGETMSSGTRSGPRPPAGSSAIGCRDSWRPT